MLCAAEQFYLGRRIQGGGVEVAIICEGDGKPDPAATGKLEPGWLKVERHLEGQAGGTQEQLPSSNVPRGACRKRLTEALAGSPAGSPKP